MEAREGIQIAMKRSDEIIKTKEGQLLMVEQYTPFFFHAEILDIKREQLIQIK